LIVKVTSPCKMWSENTVNYGAQSKYSTPINCVVTESNDIKSYVPKLKVQLRTR
jgi:hypothetical protein